MKKCNRLVKLFIVGVFLLFAYSLAFSDRTVTSINWENQEAEVISGQLVIQLKGGVNYSNLNSFLSQNNCWIEDTCNILRLALIGFSQVGDEEILQKNRYFQG